MTLPLPLDQASISDTPVLHIRPQTRNANQHTEKGMELLGTSLEDGWIGAITVAADGEAFDGSARVEVLGDQLRNAVVIDSDGSVPIVVRRTDLPTADDPRAKRLGIAANRVAQLNLSWDVDLLSEISQEVDLGDLVTADFLEDLLNAEYSDDESEGESEDAPSDPSEALEEPPTALAERYPLAIILDWELHTIWQEIKAELGVTSDTKAFLALLSRHGYTGG